MFRSFLFKKKIGYLGFVGQNNIGDDLLLESIQHLLQTAIVDSYKLYPKRHHPKIKDYDLFVCGGGTLLSALQTEWMNCLWQVKESGVPLAIFGTGVQPGNHFKKLKANEEGRKRLVEIINYAALVGVRGPDSKEELVKLGCEEKKIQIIGDPALGYPLKSKVDKNQFLGQRGASVGICIGFSGYNTYASEDHIAETVTQFCRHLLKTGYNVVFFPMRDEDIKLQQAVVRSLEHDNVRAIDKVLSIPLAFNLIQEMDVLIAGKLHPGVMATVVGVPFVTYAYEPKCIDYAKSINYLESIVKTDATLEELTDCFERIRTEKKEIVSKFSLEKQRANDKLNDFAEKIGSIISSQV